MHDEYHDSDTPTIYSLGVKPGSHFGREIGPCATRRIHASSRGDDLGQTKIGQLGDAGGRRRDENVVRLDVTVHYAPIVKVSHGGADVADEGKSAILI